MTRVRSRLVMVIALALGAALLASASAQAPKSGRRGTGMSRDSFLGIMRLEPVQKELKLSDEQIGKVSEMGEKLRAEMMEQFAGLREIEDRQKQRAKMTELRDRFEEKARGQLSQLLSRDQMMRLYQIRLQVGGALYGLNNRWVAGRLELTEEQKKKAADLEKVTEEKTFDAYSGLRDLSEEERSKKMPEAREKIGKIRSEAEKQALGILTAEQKESFEKMKGEILAL
jgi:Spy/CpxP family protein refolding chaperone